MRGNIALETASTRGSRRRNRHQACQPTSRPDEGRAHPGSHRYAARRETDDGVPPRFAVSDRA
eukprot:scaffold5126_cov125-Isochrysis_galbana.AAC.14